MENKYLRNNMGLNAYIYNICYQNKISLPVIGGHLWIISVLELRGRLFQQSDSAAMI